MNIKEQKDLWRFILVQACEAQVTSKKASLVRLETTVIAHAEFEETRWLEIQNMNIFHWSIVTKIYCHSKSIQLFVCDTPSCSYAE